MLRKYLSFKVFFLFSFLLILFTACENSTESVADPQRGDIENSIFKMAMSETALKAAAGEENIPEYAVFNYGVNIVSLEYYTETVDGELITASGALFLPVDAETFQYPDDAMPLLSLQHGTQYDRNMVSSVNFANAPEGVLAILAAMGGVPTCVPDYIGFGVSEEMHPYIIEEYTANAVIDMIRAAEEYCGQEGLLLNGELVLAGYSEGGYATMSAQKAIETEYSNEFNPVFSVPMAGPFDLSATVTHILSQENYASSEIMGFILTSYDHYYNWNKLTDIFQDPYAGQVNDLFSGNYGSDHIASVLPENMTDYVKPEFITSYLAGNETVIEATVNENDLLDGWVPQTPMLLIHGTDDEIVPFLNSQNAYDSFKAAGSDVTFLPIEGGGHLTASGPAIEAAFVNLMQQLGK